MVSALFPHIPAGNVFDPPEPPPPPPADITAVAALRTRILDALLPAQLAVCSDTQNRTIAFVAGYGSGKTHCLCAWTTLLALENPGTRGAVFAPTGPLIRDVLLPSLESYWETIGVQFVFRASPLPEFRLALPSGPVTVLCRSMENWQRIVGMELSFIGSDEIDTSKTEIARQAVRKFLARLRTGSRRQLGLFSTPEGFGLLYSLFVEEADKPDRALYKGRTADNPHLPDDYLPTLLESYPANLIAAYTEGEFVNMSSASVYPDFDRDANASDRVGVTEDDTIYCGMDFNVGRCWMVSVVRHGREFHVVAEHIARDTPQCIETLLQHYAAWRDHGQLVLCPDASAKGRSSKDAGISDIGLLRRAGFRVEYQSANPFVRDRVLSVNALVLNGKGERLLRVAPACKGVVRGLEQHAYDQATQAPEKGDGGPDDLSGQMDALGYAIWRLAGIKPWRTGQTTVEVW